MLKDRSGALVFFGIIHLIGGVICLLIILATVAVSTVPQASIAQNLLVYAVFAAYLFAVGIGSIRKRRWARALALVVSWIWLISGVISGAMLILVMPHIMVLVPPSAARMVTVFVTALVALIYVILPLVFILFYGRRDVRATVETNDTQVRWTDRVPLPVLGVSLVLAFGAVVLIANAARPVIPLFGTVLSGAPATLTALALAALLAFVAVQLYRLKESAWWTLVLLQLIGGVFAALMLARTDINRVYEQMGVMTPQIRAMHLEQIFGNPLLWGLAAVAWIAYFAFLIWIRRYFGRFAPRTRAEDA